MMNDPAQKDSGPKAAGGVDYANRRAVPRYAFIAEAELADDASSARMNVRTSELSLKGCYLDMLNLLPEGSTVHLRITKDTGIFECKGRVIYIHPGLGMGVAFTEMAPKDKAILDGWLAELSG
jgi:hypothetical protein